MKIMLLASGSGGHVYPAIAFGDYLLSLGVDVVLGVVKNGFEDRITVDPRIKKVVFEINTKTATYKRTPWKLLGLIKNVRNKTKKLCDIDAILSFGGFMSFVAVVVKHSIKCPLFLHEQNATVGDGNAFAIRFCRKIFSVYEKTNCPKKHLNKLALAGNPRSTEASKYYQTKLQTKPFKILFFAGSLGSSTLNNIIKQSITLLNDSDLELHVITGAKDYHRFSSEQSQKNVNYYAYVSNLTKMMSEMDFMIMRAGATSISEMVTLEIPSLLIPSPYVKHDHQNENARYLEALNAALVIAEKDVTAKKIRQCILQLKDNYELQYRMKHAMRKLKKPDASARIFKVIKDELKL